MIRKTATKVGRALSDALFPMTCCACGRLIQPEEKTVKTDMDELAGASPENAFRQVMHKYMCTSCIPGYTPVEPPYCTRCGEPFKSRSDKDHLCGDCITRKKHFSFARACAVYDGPVLKMIQAYKYSGKTVLAKPLGTMLYLEFLRHFRPKSIDAALAVPLHEKRIHRRGYNQTILMIRHWPAIAEKNSGLPKAKITIETNALVRSKNTAAQTGLDRRQRIKNMKNAFEVKSPERVAGKKLLLVDDVYTTGSTVEECARVLDKAGAAEVYVLTLARAV
ncbi:MAG: ComF family protein [Desulfobacteraceae bacterium]|nr:ComF family protein [Desulfobacteraceae bacterium]